MLKNIQNLMNFVLDSILPPRRDFDIVKKLNPEKIKNLPRSERVLGEDWICPLFQYKDRRVKAIVWELKYNENTLPLKQIGKILYEEIITVISDIFIFDNDAEFIIIPIPITKYRRIERGYNQSEILSKEIISNDFNHTLLYAPQWLEKIIETPRQSHSETRYDRVMNLLDSFKANQMVQNKYVILIDDVVTTGSTLKEARKELLLNGAKKVLAFTLAH
jgi:competence protein ComFC